MRRIAGRTYRSKRNGILEEKWIGNTEGIARPIAESLGTQGVPVSQIDAAQLHGLDLLVVGSPTRKFSPTEGISKLLNGLPKEHLTGTRVAAFDTRIDLETIDSKVFRFIVDKGGYAAKTIAKSLEKRR